MKNIKLAILVTLALQTGLIKGMDRPNKPLPTLPSQAGRPSLPGTLNQNLTPPLTPNTRLSGPGRPRPTAVNYSADPFSSRYSQDAYVNPLYNDLNNQPTNTTFVVQPLPSQPAADSNPASNLNAGNQITATASIGITTKERERLDKIEEKLDKITEELIKLGWALAPAGISLISLNPQGAVSSLISPDVGLGVTKLTYYLGNILKHTLLLSAKGSPAAKLELKALLPRLAIISNSLTKGPKVLQNTIGKIIDVIKR